MLRALYKQHFPSVRAHVLKNSGTVTDAEDLFQEAMAVLWLRVKDGAMKEGSEAGAFLFRVAKNKWLDQLRSASHRHMRVVPIEHIPENPVEETTATEERLARLREVYANMDERCRNVLGRFYFQREDLATIAAAMGVEEDSIRTIKYRCMMKLRAFRRRINGGDEPIRP
ncbi:MAG: sigma-70 family RNA polymerase sigma factor [Flavobacteriales bacterium]|nr:sigma-70 family RNA polymerase sigma factor [Flavobacteriales bacterium]